MNIQSPIVPSKAKTAALVDRLAIVRANRKVFEKEETELISTLRSLDLDVVEGKAWKAIFTVESQVRLDTELLKSTFKPAQLQPCYKVVQVRKCAIQAL